MSKRNRVLTQEETSWRLCSKDQRDRYLSATRQPTWRNRGPKGRHFGSRPWRAEYEIHIDVFPVDGIPGYSVPICKRVIHSRRRAKSTLQKVRRRCPTAFYVKHCFVLPKGLQT